MKPKDLKELLFNAFVEGNNKQLKTKDLKIWFEHWLKQDLDRWCNCHEPVIPHGHTELCRCPRPNYFNVGDIENGCTCTGKIDRFLTMEELLQVVEAIPDEKFAMQNHIGNMDKDTNKYNCEPKDSYWTMDHIIIFRGETDCNCPETKWVKGSLESRIVEFINIPNQTNGHVLLKAVEKKENPNYQQETQKQRVIALFKDMLNKGYN